MERSQHPSRHASRTILLPVTSRDPAAPPGHRVMAPRSRQRKTRRDLCDVTALQARPFEIFRSAQPFCVATTHVFPLGFTANTSLPRFLQGTSGGNEQCCHHDDTTSLWRTNQNRGFHVGDAQLGGVRIFDMMPNGAF